MSSKFKTKNEIIEDGNPISNGILQQIDLRVTAHFDNIVSLAGICKTEGGGYINPFGCYNTTRNIGYIIQTLFELFDLNEEDGRCLSSIKDIPVRLIWKNEKCIGIGNLLTDKFIYTEDLIRVEN